MIDLDLKLTAWRARMLIVDCLAELAPEVEGELLLGLAGPSPGAAHERVDAPPEALAARIAPDPPRSRQTGSTTRAWVEPWAAQSRLACSVAEDAPERRLRALFTLGVQRLLAASDPAGALEAFERMADEARLLLGGAHDALRMTFCGVAQEHVRLAAKRAGKLMDPLYPPVRRR